jgi:hypothetical protein
MDLLVKDTLEIQLNTGNFNRDNDFMLNRAWYQFTEGERVIPLVNYIPHSFHPHSS